MGTDMTMDSKPGIKIDSKPGTKIDLNDLPFRLSKVQSACLYLHTWQRENCRRLGANAGARQCRGGCQLPSVGQVEIRAGVKHTTAQAARKRVVARCGC